MLIRVLMLAIVILKGFAYNLTQYAQSDYLLVQERAEVVKYNKRYVSKAEIKNFKFNRTHFGMNISMVFGVDLNYTMRVNVQGYKFASNEYRLFPITFGYNFCEAMFLNSFGFQNLYGTCGNMFKCPMKKGSYMICNWVPDYTKFPPYIPRGRYMIDIEWTYFSFQVLQARWYMAVLDV